MAENHEVITVSFQMRAADNKRLRRTVEVRGEDVSSFIRRAILMELGHLGYLSPEEAKALGLGKQTSSSST